MKRKMLSFNQPHRRATSLSGVSIPALVLALAGSALAENPTVSLAMPVPSVVSAANYVGPVPVSTKLTMSIALAPSNAAAFQAYADSVGDHQSPNYRKFLTPAQIGEQFGASAATVNATVAYLKSKGLTVTLIADTRLGVTFTGTVGQAQTAFATKLGAFRGPSSLPGASMQDFYYFQTPPKVPSSIAAKVVTISGLENYYKPSPRSTLTPPMTRKLYSSDALYDDTGLGYKGEGINVGIANYDGIRLSNIPLFYQKFGLPAPSGGVGSNVTKVGLDPEQWSPGGEGDLDVQMVLAVAPKCSLFIYSQNDPLTNLLRMVNDDKVDIVSESYGWATNENTRSSIVAWHQQHLALTAEGVTYTLATGDNGTDLQGFDYPDFDPELINVGGTVANVDSTGKRINEDGWSGSGSGWSTFNIDFNTRPTWQVGSTVPTAPDRRIFPDLALHADSQALPLGQYGYQAYELYINNNLTAESGTSAASPTFAGELALILQGLSSTGGLVTDPNTGRARLGPIQKSHIYTYWGDRSDIFYDTTTGDSGKLPDGTESVGKVGWDFVTGFGAPSTSGILSALQEEFVAPITTAPDAAAIYTTSVPTFTYGSSVQGGVTDLPTADGISYSILSKSQTGVGQVAAATLDFALQSDPAKRSSVSLKMSILTERLTTDYVYLYNWTSGKYDLIKTVTSTGSTIALSSGVTLAKYVSGNGVRVLVRALKPSRLGSGSFRLNVDQAVMIERVTN